MLTAFVLEVVTLAVVLVSLSIYENISAKKAAYVTAVDSCII